jgi:hypothetical protein
VYIYVFLRKGIRKKIFDKGNKAKCYQISEYRKRLYDISHIFTSMYVDLKDTKSF